jgi:hypothetical protein
MPNTHCLSFFFPNSLSISFQYFKNLEYVYLDLIKFVFLLFIDSLLVHVFMLYMCVCVIVKGLMLS